MTTRKNARGAGRPLTHSLELPLYDSMQAMASATGIPLAALKHAKKNGCLFVRHGRCELSVFLKWFFGRDHSTGEQNEDWAKRDKRAAALMREIDLERKRESIIDFDGVDKFIYKLVRVHFFGELDRLSHEYPSSLKGKAEVAIHEECVRQAAIIKRGLESELAAWSVAHAQKEVDDEND